MPYIPDIYSFILRRGNDSLTIEATFVTAAMVQLGSWEPERRMHSMPRDEHDKRLGAAIFNRPLLGRALVPETVGPRIRRKIISKHAELGEFGSNATERPMNASSDFVLECLRYADQLWCSSIKLVLNLFFHVVRRSVSPGANNHWLPLVGCHFSYQRLSVFGLLYG
ncbi:hypothetical protein AC628_12575 [Bradyrhizobium sp. NAS96.2]|nr:hypothetical protein AC628_12575 [Bradyrhizobium sp. NAS96.2]